MKKTIAAIMLTATMATFANAGILVGGRSSGQCSTQGTGILVGGRTGIMVSDRSGVLTLIADIIGTVTSNACSTSERDGILVGG